METNLLHSSLSHLNNASKTVRNSQSAIYLLGRAQTESVIYSKGLNYGRAVFLILA
jgi:hypothetical protein